MVATCRSPEAEEEKAQEEMKHRMEEAARDSAASAEARGRPTMAAPNPWEKTEKSEFGAVLPGEEEKER